MRLTEGMCGRFRIRTFGKLRFSALRRGSSQTNEDGTISNEIKEPDLYLKILGSRSNDSSQYSSKCPLREFDYDAEVDLVNPMWILSPIMFPEKGPPSTGSLKRMIWY